MEKFTTCSQLNLLFLIYYQAIPKAINLSNGWSHFYHIEMYVAKFNYKRN